MSGIEEKAKFAKDIAHTLNEAYANTYDVWKTLQLEEWVRLSDAQQEIDNCKASWQNLKDVIPKFDAKIAYLEAQLESRKQLVADMQRECGEQKQKLQSLKKAMFPHANTCRKCPLRSVCSKEWKTHPSYQCNAIQDLGKAYHVLREYERLTKP